MTRSPSTQPVRFAADFQHLNAHRFAVASFSQTLFNYNTTAAYVLEFDTAAYQPRVLAIYSSTRKVIDPVFEKLKIITDKIKSLYQNFTRQQKDINYVRNILDLAVRPD